MSETETEQEDRVLTPEEMAEQRKKMDDFYSDNIPLLEKQLHYEGLLADIDEARLKRMMVRQKLIEMSSPAPRPGDTPPEGPKRQLKTD
jgi:hypothetical protein